MSEQHKFPSQMQDRFIVRFPEGMREALKASAAANGRSLNSEIIHRLSGADSSPLPISEDEPAIDRQQERYERLECCRLASELLRDRPDSVMPLAREFYSFLGEGERNDDGV